MKYGCAKKTIIYSHFFSTPNFNSNYSSECFCRIDYFKLNSDDKKMRIKIFPCYGAGFWILNRTIVYARLTGLLVTLAIGIKGKWTIKKTKRVILVYICKNKKKTKTRAHTNLNFVIFEDIPDQLSVSQSNHIDKSSAHFEANTAIAGVTWRNLFTHRGWFKTIMATVDGESRVTKIAALQSRVGRVYTNGLMPRIRYVSVLAESQLFCYVRDLRRPRSVRRIRNRISRLPIFSAYLSVLPRHRCMHLRTENPAMNDDGGETDPVQSINVIQ